jgi:hypothetical protein
MFEQFGALWKCFVLELQEAFDQGFHVRVLMWKEKQAHTRYVGLGTSERT